MHPLALGSEQDELQLSLDALIVAPRMTANAELLAPLGLIRVEVRMGEQVMGTQIEADPSGATSVPGGWAAGNLANIAAQVITSAAAGLTAGAAINADLAAEDAERAAGAARNIRRSLQPAPAPRRPRVMRNRSWPVDWSRVTALRATLIVAAALTAASCGAVPFGSGHGALAERIVPWVNRPGRIIWPRPLPRHYIPATARPCTAADLRVFPAGGNGATGHSEMTVGVRNISATACLLKGYPRVIATEPSHKPVIATDGGYLVGRERPGNMSPGGVTWLNLETDRDCPARYAKPGRFPTRVYHTVTVSIPGGGKVVLHQGFDVLCGLFTGQFGVTEPPQRYVNPPWTRVRVALELPASVTASSVLHYVVDLTNPTGTPMRLSPCPGYSQGIAVAGKSILQLNCAGVPGRKIPARQTVRFAMRMPVPTGTPTGPTWVGWTIAGSVTAYAHGSVRVIGHDVPCTAAQLKAVITGPGQVPGPPNLLGMKGMATAVPLEVTNVSSRPCSVYGSPGVIVKAASGRTLKLTQIPYTNYELPPSRPLPRVIVLAAHGGTARTTLYWYLPWCAPDPNPVTVLITLGANHARLSVTPAGGWTPPACRSGTPSRHGSPGEVSADPFRAG